MHVHFILVRELFDPELRRIPDDDVVASSVDVFLRGVEAPKRAPRRAAGKARGDG